MLTMVPAGAPRPAGAWLYKMTRPSDKSVWWADDATELAGVAYNPADPGAYLALPDEDKLWWRYQQCLRAVDLWRAVESDQQEEAFAAADPDEAEATAFMQPADRPVEGLPGGRWRFDQDLYIIATDYEPYTDIPLPQGEHVQVCDPHDDLSFLATMVPSFEVVG